MTFKEWKEIITSNCKSIGTYQDHFIPVIDTLAQILENRDITHKQWVLEGSEPVVIHVNKAGEPNPVKNPLLVLENDMNSLALSYWRDLGLTPSGLRKLNADVVIKEEKGGFEELLSKLSG